MTNRVENAKDLTAEQVREIAAIVRIAIAEPCEFIPLNGCGRVYMHIGYSKIMKGYAIAKALNNVGPIRVTQRPGEKGYTFYMGYDNAHDGHHRHYFGVVEPVDFVSFEDIEERFAQDWIILKDCK